MSVLLWLSLIGLVIAALWAGIPLGK